MKAQSRSINKTPLSNLGHTMTRRAANKCLFILVAGILALSTPGIAMAQLSLTASIGGIPTVSGATLLNFDGSAPAILTLSSGAYLVTGDVNALSQSPYFSGSTAAYFGETPASGYDLSQYVAVTTGATATFTFASPQNYFGLLVGSIDPGNSLTFYDSANAVIGTVTGNDIASIPPITLGDAGPNGTAYVNISSTISFSKVVANSSNISFEFDDVAFAAVPEPASLALLGAGLLILHFGSRRKTV